MRVLLATTRSWHLDRTALAFSAREALAALWMSDRNRVGIPEALFRRCWPYHLAMKPLYHLAPQIWDERATYWFIGFWKAWLRRRLRPGRCPEFQAAQAIVGFGSEVFDYADRVGALKIVECPNSHPTTYFGFWQRECDLWCPGERVPIPRWMFARMNREIERADLVLVASTFCKESMALNGIPLAKVLVNPFGADGAVFQKRADPPTKPRFINVGTICLRKGHQYLFRAFRIVKERLPEAELICVGDHKCDFRRERPKWEGTYTHRESLSHAELAPLLRSCTAFVFPSQEEGFARVQSEALASGLPLIGTHEGGATTVVDHGVEGFIVPGRDPQAIAQAMIRLATDPELNRRMGEAAYRKGAIQNSWQDYGDRLLDAYRQRLAARAPQTEN